MKARAQNLLKSTLFACIFSFSCGISAQTTILDCLALNKMNPESYIEGDLRVKDTVIDLANGYYALRGDNGTGLMNYFQAAMFNNDDGTILLAITGYYSDEQCSNHSSYFYEINVARDKILATSPLPNFDLKMFLDQPKVLPVMEKYLPAVQDEYLSDEADIDEMLFEVYNFHYIIPQKGTSLTATLTLCDYIPTNVVSIDPKDWEIIEQGVQTYQLSYNNKTKKFQP